VVGDFDVERDFPKNKIVAGSDKSFCRRKGRDTARKQLEALVSSTFGN
jgi:hypothetical protein